MATLPLTSVNIGGNLRYQDQPSLTWKIDKESNRITGTCDGWDAVRQAVEIILYVERFRWQIYTPYSGMQWDGLLGENPGYVIVELQRRIREALMMDNRVTGISDFGYYQDEETLNVSFTVDTVYGGIPIITGVDLL